MANIEAFKTPQGYLKIIHVILGVIALGVIGHYTAELQKAAIFIQVMVPNEFLAFLFVSFAFLLTSFLLVVSLLLDESSDNLTKSIFDILFSLFGFIFYFSVSIALFALLGKFPIESKKTKDFAGLIVATVCGLLNSFAYLANAFAAFRSRRS